MLAGCAVPDEEPAQPLLGVCPQWEAADWQERTALGFNASAPGVNVVHAPVVNGTPLSHPSGFPIDRYRVTLETIDVVEGTLELRAFADGADRQRGIQDYRDPQRPLSVPVLALGPDARGDQEFDIFLSPVAHGSPAAPDDLRLAWSLESWDGGGNATVTYTVQVAYRICGAVLP